jgi:hypothetical protein
MYIAYAHIALARYLLSVTSTRMLGALTYLSARLLRTRVPHVYSSLHASRSLCYSMYVHMLILFISFSCVLVS